MNYYFIQSMVAVITADLINSTSYEKTFLKEVITVLKSEFNAISQEQDALFTIFRGDSFQGIVKRPEDALQIALRLKAAVLKVQCPIQKKIKCSCCRCAHRHWNRRGRL